MFEGSLISKVKFLTLIPLLGVMLSCTSASTIATDSDMQLCSDYLSYPDYNIWHDTRAREISRRGIDCTQYLGIANQRIKANQAAQQVLQGIANTGTTNNTNTYKEYCIKKGEYKQGLNKVCQYSCTGNAHAITIASTAICPLQVTR